jgi:hypothetical protein
MISTEQAAVRGAFVGVVVFLPGAFGASLIAGSGIAGALAIAAYGSFFGGIGFGAMLGAVIHLVRAEAAEEAELAALPGARCEGRDHDDVAGMHRAA